MGGEADEIGVLWDTMYRGVLLQGRVGLVMNGISAIDIALWDRWARVAGRPLYQELGAGSAGGRWAVLPVDHIVPSSAGFAFSASVAKD